MQFQELTAAPFLLIIFLGCTALALLAFQFGLRLGRWRKQQPDPESEQGARIITAGVLKLLAFILGFTFHLATSHFDSRNQALANEAIAIGTAYRRADLLQEPERSKLRDLLREYVDLRLEGPRAANIDEVIARLQLLQERIWTVRTGNGHDGGPLPTLLIQSLNDVIDVSAGRVLTNMQSRIPPAVWVVLAGMGVVSVAVAGYLSGFTGSRRRSLAALGYALVFALIIMVTVDVDVPRFGHFRESDQPLVVLRAQISQPAR